MPFLVEPNGVAIDGGPNRGVYSVCLSSHCRCVYAFEPNPAMCGYLRPAVPDNVSVSECALSDSAGKAQFNVPMLAGQKLQDTGGGLSAAVDHAETVSFSVDTATIDQLGLTDVSFIKLDLEGGELDALRGEQETTKRDRPNMILEIHPDRGSDFRTELRSIVEKWGYLGLVLHRGQLILLQRTLQSGKTQPESHNFIFISKSRGLVVYPTYGLLLA